MSQQKQGPLKCILKTSPNYVSHFDTGSQTGSEEVTKKTRLRNKRGGKSKSKRRKQKGSKRGKRKGNKDVGSEVSEQLLGVKHVIFCERVLVYTLPSKTAEEQWLARFGIWKTAPFHDELWDGYLQAFRSKVLTKKQLVKVNREYKWRRRLPNKVFSIVFERGKAKGNVKIAQSKDEVELLNERRIKIMEANREVNTPLHVKSFKSINEQNQGGEKDEPTPTRRTRSAVSMNSIMKTNSNSNSVSKDLPTANLIDSKQSTSENSEKQVKQKVAEDEYEIRDEREVSFVSEEEIDIDDLDSVAPRHHSFEQLLKTNPSGIHHFVKQNSKLLENKQKVLTAFDAYEEKKRRESARSDSQHGSRVYSKQDFEDEELKELQEAQEALEAQQAGEAEEEQENLEQHNSDDDVAEEPQKEPVVFALDGNKTTRRKRVPRTKAAAEGESGVLDGVRSLGKVISSFFYTPHEEHKSLYSFGGQSEYDDEEENDDDTEYVDGLNQLDGIRHSSLMQHNFSADELAEMETKSSAKVIKKMNSDEGQSEVGRLSRSQSFFFSLFDKFYAYDDPELNVEEQAPPPPPGMLEIGGKLRQMEQGNESYEPKGSQSKETKKAIAGKRDNRKLNATTQLCDTSGNLL